MFEVSVLDIITYAFCSSSFFFPSSSSVSLALYRINKLLDFFTIKMHIRWGSALIPLFLASSSFQQVPLALGLYIGYWRLPF